MERQFSQTDYHSTEQPQFDEEWTLLTARPVVPLQEVKASKAKRRMFKLVSLFAAALMLGAVSALVVVSLERRQMVAPVAVEAEEQQPAPTPEQEAAKSVETNVPEANTETEVAPTAPKTVAVVRTKTKAAEREAEEKPAAHTDKPAQADGDTSAQSQPVLFDEFRPRWEERRARRFRRQERRENWGRRGRDLRRIDEIFEGPRP